jgi:hypothetical protein
VFVKMGLTSTGYDKKHGKGSKNGSMAISRSYNYIDLLVFIAYEAALHERSYLDAQE